MTGYGAPGPTPAAKQALPLFDLIGAGLGVLSFIWGFLNFYSSGGQDAKGYNAGSSATAAIGLSILAGAIAGAVILSEKAEPLRPPYALATAVSALLMSFGVLVAKGDGISAKYGLILLLITTAAQVAVFAYSWLQATGKIASKPAVPQQWGGPQQYGQQPATFGQQQSPVGGGYGAPRAPSGYSQPTTTFGEPSQPAQPPSDGGYGPSTTHGGGYSQPPGAPAPQPGQAPPAGPGQPGGGYGQPPTSGGYGQG